MSRVCDTNGREEMTVKQAPRDHPHQGGRLQREAPQEKQLMPASLRTWALVSLSHVTSPLPPMKSLLAARRQSWGLAEAMATASREHTFIPNYVPMWTLLGKHCKLLLLPLKMPFESKRAPTKWGQIKTTNHR